MANYNLVIGSKFLPFSFDRYIQPYVMVDKEYRDILDLYSELATLADVWSNVANGTEGTLVQNLYNRYTQDLSNYADLLSKLGLTPLSRREMLNMKKRYAKEIVPIEKAFNRRLELVNEQRKLTAQDNTMMFDKNASMLSLDDLILNPQLTYQSYSGSTIAKQVGTAALNLAKEMRLNPRKWNSILHGQYFETMMKKGYTPEEVILASSNDPNAPKELRDIVENAVSSSNIASWGNKALLDRAYDYARQGLWNAIGETQYQTIQNQNYLNPLQKLQKEKLEKELNLEPSNKLYYRAVPKSTVDGDKNTRQMNEDLKLIQEIMSNPALLNKKDTRTVRNPKYISPDPMMSLVIDSGYGESKQETYYPYLEKLAELSKRYGNINYTITDGKLSSGNLAELAQQLDRNIKSSVVRSLSYKPNITLSDLITQVLKENTRSYYRRSNNTGLYELEDNKKGDAIDIKDLNSYFTSDSDIDFDPDLGFIINSTDKDGKTRSAVIDTELLDDQERTFRKALRDIKIALDNGEGESATLLIEALMQAFYNRYNTLEKRQSNTFSKEE